MMSVSAWYLLKKRHLDLREGQHEGRPGRVHPVRDGELRARRARAGDRGHQRAAAQAGVDGGPLGEHVVRPAVPRGLGGRGDPDDDRDLDPVPAERAGLPATRRPRSRASTRSPPDPTPPINLRVSGLPLHVRPGVAVRADRPARRPAVLAEAAAVHDALDALDPRRHGVLRRGGDHRRLVDGGDRAPAVGRLQRARDGRRRLAHPERPRRRRLARHVHRAVRDPAGAVPVPPQPGDPARPGAAGGAWRPSTAATLPDTFREIFTPPGSRRLERRSD